MAKIPVRERPTELPHSHIYLDQVEAIQQVFLEYLPKEAESTFSYDVDETDRFTSLAELVEHGGSTDKFSLRLTSRIERFSNDSERPWTTTVYYTGGGFGSSSRFSVPYHLKEHEWSIGGKIQQIIEPRVDFWKRLLDPIPPVAVMLPTIILGYAINILSDSKHREAALISAVLCVLSLILFALKGYFDLLWKGRVYLRYERDVQKDKAQRRNEALKLLGASVFGYLFKILTDYITPIISKHH